MSAAVVSSPERVSKVQMGLTTRLTPGLPLTDAGELDRLAAALEECVAAGDVRVAIDLGQSSVLTSVALEFLVDAQEKMLRAGGWLQLVNVAPTIVEILTITGVGSQIAIADRDASGAGTSRAMGGEGRQRFGDILIARELIDPARIEEAVRIQAATGQQLAQIVVDKNWVSEQDVLEALGNQLDVPHVRLRPGLYDPAVSALLDRDRAKRLKVMPLFKVRGEVTLATTQPQSMPILQEVEDILGLKVRPVLALREDILKAIAESSSLDGMVEEFMADAGEDFELIESSELDDYSTIDEMAAGSPVVNLVNSLIHRAVKDGASDIHIEPFRSLSRVRLRIDGVLYEAMTPRVELHPALISRLKVMANLDIGERRLPQDGRIQVHTQGRSVDLRFSSLPGLHGEKVVLRVLDKNNAILDLDKLGMSGRNLATYKDLLGRGFGLILVTGPTGSGKTTSLYAALNHINSLDKSIVTIEDPVEYQMDVINQNEVREKIGLTFAKMLKHVLRQDPDIVMVGEIRERETAEIAVQAALTGHLVLSTLHTNDSAGAITRLIDMGVEPYLLSSALIGVMAQRLVRTVCPACKTTFVADPALIKELGWPDDAPIKLARGRGCRECYDSGYKGRIAIHETLTTDTDLQRLIVSNPSKDELTLYLGNRGFVNLFADGLERVRQQSTTVEEVSRVMSM